MSPLFPANSPYILAVGGITWKDNDPTKPSAWSLHEGCTGGGFSDEFAAPPFQAEAVAAYLQKAATTPGMAPPAQYRLRAVYTLCVDISESFTLPLSLDLYLPPSYLVLTCCNNLLSRYNRTGRAYPDVSAFMDGVPLCFNGRCDPSTCSVSETNSKQGDQPRFKSSETDETSLCNMLL
jgi:hypothetical protein